MANQEKKEKKYYLGLDAGTNSLGSAVTDDDYKLIKKHGKHLWGSRLFGEASSAKGRRQAREARRRLYRRRERILLLQEIFKPEMDKVDSDFFDRLNNSSLRNEDKSKDEFRNRQLIFDQEKDGYSDSQFYKDYPTIYHLRWALINNKPNHKAFNGKFDIRMVYLAIVHMIKYRGHFLNEDDLSETSKNGTEADLLVGYFGQLNNALSNYHPQSDEDDDTDSITPASFNVDETKAELIKKAFQERLKTAERTEKVAEIIGIQKNNLNYRLLEVICGSKKKLNSVFSDELKDNQEAKSEENKVDFSKQTFREETLSTLNSFADGISDILMACLPIYDYRVLVRLLRGKAYLSEAMVELHEVHKKQLSELKRLIKTYCTNVEYSSFFRKPKEENEASYSGYIGSYLSSGKRIRTARFKKKIDKKEIDPYDSLTRKIKELLPKEGRSNRPYRPEDAKKIDAIHGLIEQKEYLLRQNSSDNGVFPHQLNLNELNEIIANIKDTYPSLATLADDYMNPKRKTYKLASLLEYKIPYFVGPLSGKNSNNFWMVRKEGKEKEKITPWNFHEVVNEGKTAQQFIERLKNKCTYLINEQTLPKNSLLYSEYMIHNELANLRINGDPITQEIKDRLIEELYKKDKNITRSKLEKALKQILKEEVTLTTRSGKGIEDDDLHANLSPFIDMSTGFGEDIDRNPDLYETAEKVIYALTVFEDKGRRRKALQDLGLSDEQVKYFASLNYEGWGALSKKVLTGISDNPSKDDGKETFDPETGEIIPSIIYKMKNTSNNLMEIIATEDSPYARWIDYLNNQCGDGSTSVDELIEESYASPRMKRTLRQAIKVVEEYRQIIFGKDSDKSFDTIFVETTREPSNKSKGQKTKSRYKTLEAIYKKAKLLEEEIGNELKNYENNQKALDGKKLFLYFLQLGKDVYTGKTIDLNDLFDSEKYDVDHIIPQAKVLDNSIDNLVLTSYDVNRKKADEYPISRNLLTEEGITWVKRLNKINNGSLMSKAKMQRILRTKALTEEEEVGFVNAQLVSTAQAAKAIKNILNRLYPNTRVVFTKANNVSEFRRMFHLVKCRSINDFHHAYDAYLNIVVGNVYDKKFTARFNKNMLHQIETQRQDPQSKKKPSLKTNVESIFKNDVYAYGNKNEIVWQKPNNENAESTNRAERQDGSKLHGGTIDIVRKTLSWNDPMVTWMPHTQKGKQGFFNKITILSAGGKDKASFPLKGKENSKLHSIEKYGGYSDLITPYFILVKSVRKKKTIYSLESIPAIFGINPETEEGAKAAVDYLTHNEYGPRLESPEIIVSKVLIGTLIKMPEKEVVEEKDSKEAPKLVACSLLKINGRSGSSIVTSNASELHISDTKLDSSSETSVIDYIQAINKILGKNNQVGIAKPKDEEIASRCEHGVRILNKDIYFSKANNCKVFDFITSKYEEKQYIGLPGVGSYFRCADQKKSIKANKPKFEALEVWQQIKVLDGMISLIITNGVNLSDLLGNNAKTLGQNRSINKVLEAGTQLITTSATGFYQKILFEVPQD